MTARTNLVKSSLLALAVGASLSTSGVAKAQQIVYTGGGSSALQGSYSPNASGVLNNLGAIPSLVINFPGQITGFGTFAANQGILTANVTISGENTTTALVLYSSTNNIIILVRSDSGYGPRYVALQESITAWSGFHSYNPGTLTSQATTAGDTTIENYLIANQNTFAERVFNGLSDVSADAIVLYSGFSGINSVAGLANLAAATHDTLPVQTLLALYNKQNHVLGNITREQARSLIAGLPGSVAGAAITWKQLNAVNAADPVYAYYRESTSGTRNTEFLDVQRISALPAGDINPGNFDGFTSIIAENEPTLSHSNPVVRNNRTAGTNYGVGKTATLTVATVAGASNTITLTGVAGIQAGQPLYIVDGAASETVNVDPTYVAGANPVLLKAGSHTANAHAVGTLVQFNNANGTGNHINAINWDTNGIGFSFVTGTNGNGKTNLEVAAVDGVLPLDTTAFPKAADGGQAAGTGITYASQAATYYPTTRDGQYELWAFGNQYESGDSPAVQTTTAGSIRDLLDSQLTAAQLHSLGLTRVSEMNVTRVAAFGVIVAADTVTDGNLITFDLTAGPANPSNGVGGLDTTPGNSPYFGADPGTLSGFIQ